jgi:hypothetical protein
MRAEHWTCDGIHTLIPSDADDYLEKLKGKPFLHRLFEGEDWDDCRKKFQEYLAKNLRKGIK